MPLDSKLGELTLVSESIATGFSVPHLTIISPIIIETAPRPDRETLLSFFAYVVFEGALEKQGDESQRRGRNLAVGAINYFRGFAKALDGETQGLANSLLEHEAFKEAAQLLETGERIDRRAK